MGKEAEFTVSRLAARRVAKIRTFSDCKIDVLHVIIWEKCLKLCKIVIKIMDEKVKKSREVCCVFGCENNKKNSPDRIFYSFSIKKHKLEQRENGLQHCVVRSKLFRITYIKNCHLYII